MYAAFELILKIKNFKNKCQQMPCPLCLEKKASMFKTQEEGCRTDQGERPLEAGRSAVGDHVTG